MSPSLSSENRICLLKLGAVLELRKVGGRNDFLFGRLLISLHQLTKIQSHSNLFGPLLLLQNRSLSFLGHLI